MEIYLDLILLINFMFNWALIILTSYLLRIKLSVYEKLIGTGIASAILPIIIYFPESMFNTALGKIFYSMVIVIGTFRFKSIKSTLTALLTFYFVSFSIGGGLFGIHYILQESFQLETKDYLLSVPNIYGDQISVLLLFIGCIILFFFTKSRMDRQLQEKVKGDQLLDVSITINGKTNRTTGFVDTGNHLVDPLTNRPVIICDELFLKQFFSIQEWLLLQTAIHNDDPSSIPLSLQKKMCIVPYQGVEGSSHYLYTMKPDKLVISLHDQYIDTNNVLVGIQLSLLTNDESYHCLLHPKLIYFYPKKTA